MTDISPMVERVAIAAYMATGLDTPWPDVTPEYKEMVYRVTRAAISAMREPTEAMLSAGNDEAHHHGFVSPVWRAMIDAALAPERAVP